MRPSSATGAVYVLVVILVGAAMAQEQPKPVTLEVVMLDFRFVPDHLTFARDVHYRLHLENHGALLHEFTAPAFFATAEIDNPGVLNAEHTEVVMQPGETKDVYLTARRPGIYDLRCADHDWAGMVGGITVEDAGDASRK